MVEVGTSPLLSASELEAIGFKLVIFPGGAVRALAHALQRYYAALIADGSTKALLPQILDLAGINRILATEGFLELGRRYDPAEVAR